MFNCFARLFEADEIDLITDLLTTLPRDKAKRKISDLIKRARLGTRTIDAVESFFVLVANDAVLTGPGFDHRCSS